MCLVFCRHSFSINKLESVLVKFVKESIQAPTRNLTLVLRQTNQLSTMPIDINFFFVAIRICSRMSRKEALSQFINQIHGRPVVVKLNSGVDYRGECVSASNAFSVHLNDIPRILLSITIFQWNAGQYIAIKSIATFM